MTCYDLKHLLVDASPASPLPSEADDHLKRCTECRNLAEALSLSPLDGVPSAGTLRRIEESIATDLRAVRPIAPPFRLVLAFVASVLAVVGLGISAHGALALHAMAPFQAGGILGALIVVAALLAWSLSEQIIPGSPCRIRRSQLPLTTVVCLTMVIIWLFPFANETHFWRTSWACIRSGSSIAAGTAISLWLVLRRGAILSRPLTGVTAGLLAGLAGTTVLETSCPNTEAWHVLTAHLGVAILAAMAGFVIGSIAGTRAN
jgi:negative regulator of sigma F NrsF-like protein